jgi:hypothetical protein
LIRAYADSWGLQSPIGPRIDALVIKDERKLHDKVVVSLEDSNGDRSGVLDWEDADSEMNDPAVSVHKEQLMR